MKRILVSMVAVAAVWGGVSFADVQVNFYNKLYSEDPFLRHHDDNGDGDYKTDAYFPGIKERMYADIKTAKVDAGIKGTLYFGQGQVRIDDEKSIFDHFHFSGEIDDWWVEFRPIDMITLGLHDTIWADGSYFPIWDDNATAGNIGSDGFTFVIRPIKMLRLAATVPSGMDYGTVNWLSDDHDFHFGTGAILDLDMFQASVNMQGIPCRGGRQLGTFVNMPGFFGVVKALSIGAGFTHAWGNDWNQNYLKDLIADAGMAYTNLLNTYVTYDARSFRLKAELAWDFDFDDNNKDKDYYDFYTAVAFSFGLVDKLSATATGKLLFDFADNGLGNGYGASFAVDYEINKRHAIGAKAEVNKVDKYWDFAIPVYWKYSLEY